MNGLGCKRNLLIWKINLLLIEVVIKFLFSSGVNRQKKSVVSLFSKRKLF